MPRGQRIKAVNRPAVNRVTTEELQRSRLREEAAAQGRAGTTQFNNGGTRQERWHERLTRQAHESSAHLQAWLANQWMGSGAAGTVEETQRSVRGNLRHVMGRLNQHIETIRQEGWEALEDRLDPGASRQRRRGGGFYESAGDNTVQSVWESFFERMLTCVDSALCEGWIVPDDLSEPFIQLGMPALAIMDIALASRENVGVTLRPTLVVTQDMLELESFSDAKELFEEVEAVKLALVRGRVRSQSEEDFMLKSSLYAGAKDIVNEIPVERRNELNGILASAQRVAIKLTQKAFYKEQSDELIAEMNRREEL